MEMHERIVAVLKETGLTKTAFAARLNLSQPHVSRLCTGETRPSDRTINDICKTFGVNEPWLRTGEGEMFVDRSKKEEIAFIVGRILHDDSDFRQKLISVLARMTPEETELLKKMAVELAEEMKNAGP